MQRLGVAGGVADAVVIQLVAVVEIRWVWIFFIRPVVELRRCVRNHNSCIWIQGLGLWVIFEQIRMHFEISIWMMAVVLFGSYFKWKDAAPNGSGRSRSVLMSGGGGYVWWEPMTNVGVRTTICVFLIGQVLIK